jgi:hypothetical protein
MRTSSPATVTVVSSAIDAYRCQTHKTSNLRKMDRWRNP